MIRIGILGPTGYAGLQLIRILLRHPKTEIVYLGARRPERPAITEIWPTLTGRLDQHCAILNEDPIPEMDLAFLSLPHTLAMDHVPELRQRNVKVIDISADYRLKDSAAFAKWYKVEHKDPQNLKQAVYGLCELFGDEIAGAGLVANPGCYATAVELCLAPLLASGLTANARIVVDAKSGISGAGRTPREDLHFPEANESVTAYKIGTHQHSGEIIQTARRLAGRNVDLLMVPHLIPMDRGILATCYVPVTRELSTQELTSMYHNFYVGKPFVRVFDAIPTTKQVYDTNYCDLAVRGVGQTAIIVGCIDNLVKGAAGQAVQNMNLMFDLDETLGLL